MTVPPMLSDWCFRFAPAGPVSRLLGDRGAAGHVCPGGDNRPVEPLVVGGVARMRPGPDADHESRSAGHRRGVDGVRPGGVGPSVNPLWPAHAVVRYSLMFLDCRRRRLVRYFLTAPAGPVLFSA
jgi:hypothetical protein